MVIEEVFQDQQLLYNGSDFSVYKYTSETGEPRVLKVLNTSSPDNTQVAHFNNEIFISGKLNIHGVRKIFGQTKYLDCPALVMEHFDGEDLEQFVADGLDTDVFLPIAIKLCEVLGNIHLNHVTHKDINGRNILINRTDREVRVIDFGMSTMLNTEQQNLEYSHVIRGTMTHISPEQTGRMNRKVDYRSDIYSLGITFYHMLTGFYPFTSSDPLELIHFHIAKKPELDGIPYPCNLVLEKMLAKNADERYNSAFGIYNDLEAIQKMAKSVKMVNDFKPGQLDNAPIFNIRQKLYGRQQEIETLLDTFTDVNNGKTRMLLVAGYSGIGKTTLINEIHRPISINQSLFSSGKFDQYYRNIPYYAFIQAFQSLVEQLLTEPEEKLNEWRTRIRNAVGINGQLIIDVIPSVVHIIGEQSSPLPIPAAEANNRFSRVLLNFINVFAQKEHPLVLFLDDLQWADIASLKLIEQLMEQLSNHYLLILGAYRNNEVDHSHPLMLTMNNIKQNNGKIDTLFLKPLELDEINELVSDSLQLAKETTQQLSELVNEKTGGNPFFINQFLYKLYNDGKITFSKNHHKWVWDITDIEDEHITDNVIDLMKSNILKLPEASRQVVKLSACIGNEFDLHTLSIVSKQSPDEVVRLLWPSLEIGLIFPLNENYKIYGFQPYEGTTLPANNARFSFLHDRIQQAAYSLIPDEDKAPLHLEIGKNLLQSKDEAQTDDNLFDILFHINQAVPLITSGSDKIAFAKLNQRAGIKAKASAAYTSASKFFEKAAELMGGDALQTRFDLSFPLYLDYAEVSYLGGDIEKAESLIEKLLQVDAPRLDKAKIYIHKSIMYLQVGRLTESSQACKDALQLFDITVPGKVTPDVLMEAYMQLEQLRAGKPISGFYDLPEITDEDQFTIFQIFFNYATPAYYTDQNLWIWIIYQEIAISIKYGNSSITSAVYCAFGLILGSGLGDYDSGFAYGELGQKLNDKYNNVSLKSKICVIFGQMISHWKRHFKHSVPMAKEGFLIGNETGDLVYAGTNALHYCWGLFLTGRPLPEVIDECERYIEYFVKTRQNTGDTVVVCRQLSKALSGLTSTFTNFSDDSLDEEKLLDQLKSSALLLPLHSYYLAKQRLYFYAGLYNDSLQMAELAKPINFTSLGMNYTPEEFYYEALANIAKCRTEKSQLPAHFEELTQKLAHWAKHCPDNFLHKLELVQAEKLSLENNSQAAQQYEDAIKHAGAGGFIYEEALGNELAAFYYLRNNNHKMAKAYLTESRNQYLAWGAVAKAKQLEQQYPHLIYGKIGAEYSGLVTARLIESTQDLIVEPDILTILKASTAISGEVKIENLLSKLINITIENAGAEKGTIILNENGAFLIKANKEADGTITVLQDTPLQQFEGISKSIIQYVIRTRENVILDDATTSERFAKDPYIVKSKPRSILCMPIISKGNLIGLLYLENNLASNAFTPHRLDLMQLISGQIAISIDNAFLYENLEKKVKMRTAELEAEKETSDKLLRNILPEETAEELKRTGTAVPKSYDQVSILFTDFKGFTKLSEKLSPKAIIEKLDYCFANFDKIASRHNLEKIKTIGDSYMCAGGIPIPNSTNPVDAVLAGLEIQDFITRWNEAEAAGENETWKIRVGINTGKVVAGVVGQSKFAYDIWGDAVNLASGMEQCGQVGKVNISQATYDLVKDHFLCESRGKIKPKNKEEVDMYFVLGKK